MFEIAQSAWIICGWIGLVRFAWVMIGRSSDDNSEAANFLLLIIVVISIPFGIIIFSLLGPLSFLPVFFTKEPPNA